MRRSQKAHFIKCFENGKSSNRRMRKCLFQKVASARFIFSGFACGMLFGGKGNHYKFKFNNNKKIGFQSDKKVCDSIFMPSVKHWMGRIKNA
jgi:hypothetical protein